VFNVKGVLFYTDIENLAEELESGVEEVRDLYRILRSAKAAKSVLNELAIVRNGIATAIRSRINALAEALAELEEGLAFGI